MNTDNLIKSKNSDGQWDGNYLAVTASGAIVGVPLHSLKSTARWATAADVAASVEAERKRNIKHIKPDV